MKIHSQQKQYKQTVDKSAMINLKKAKNETIYKSLKPIVSKCKQLIKENPQNALKIQNTFIMAIKLECDNIPSIDDSQEIDEHLLSRIRSSYAPELKSLSITEDDRRIFFNHEDNVNDKLSDSKEIVNLFYYHVNEEKIVGVLREWLQGYHNDPNFSGYKYAAVNIINAIKTGDNELNLSNLHLDTLPRFESLKAFFTNITNVDFSHNNLTAAGLENVGVFANVQRLDLSYNGIECIPELTFYDCKKLQNLDCSHNNILELNDNTLAGPTDLIVVNLSYNEIQKLTTGVLKNQILLEKLHLCDNFITEVPNGFFDGLKALDECDLSYNAIDALPDFIFKQLSKLRFLDLTFNAINEVTVNQLAGLDNLRSLDIKHNPIKDVSLLTQLQETIKNKLANQTVPKYHGVAL